MEVGSDKGRYGGVCATVNCSGRAWCIPLSSDLLEPETYMNRRRCSRCAESIKARMVDLIRTSEANLSDTCDIFFTYYRVQLLKILNMTKRELE